MPRRRVTLLRVAVCLILGAGTLSEAARGATGGAGVPGGLASASPTPADGAPVPTATASDASSTPDGSTPTPSSADAALAQVTPTVPAMPVLATAARRPEDPVAQDLAALTAPSPIAAIDGHVIVVRPRGAMSELVDLGRPEAPRVLLASTRVFGAPHAGRDASGRAVVVVSPCAGSPITATGGQAPRCPLRSIDLESTASTALPGTVGALAGDRSGSQLVFTRPSPEAGVRLYASTDAGTARLVTLPPVAGSTGRVAASARPVAGSLRATALDVDDAGRIAVVLEYAAHAPTASSALWLRSAAGAWTRAASATTGFAGLGTRHVLGPRLDATGVTAYVEGVVETPSFLGHWTDTGQPTGQLSLRRSLGRTTILAAAAYDAGRLVVEDWLPGVPCGSEDAPACGLRSVGPVSVP